MIPFGAQHLIKLRQHGKRPVNRVWVNYGDDCVALEWWRWADTQARPTLTIRASDPIDRLDLRCLIGLAVTFYFTEWDARIARLLERLKSYSPEIVVVSPCFEDDLGFWWSRDQGQFPIDQHPQAVERSAA